MWQSHSLGSGYFELRNKNSGKLMEIPNASTSNGTQAKQWGYTGHITQNWSFTPTSDGYARIANRNSLKFLEILQNSQANGAIADQWSNTGCTCQEWTIRREGIQ